jgi:hypothetical protein
MDATQFERVVHATLDARPFVPFIIVLDDGQELHVDHPDALMYGRHTTIYFGADDLVQLFDHRAVIDVRQPKEATAS